MEIFALQDSLEKGSISRQGEAFHCCFEYWDYVDEVDCENEGLLAKEFLGLGPMSLVTHNCSGGSQ